MAKLVRKTKVGKQKVYDLTVADTHSFFAYSRYGNVDYGVLAHNCHEMSKSAMDALLKPLEDNVRGTEEKQLVCIFCTTEPNKMRGAIMSRCAPAFKISSNTPELIAQRLAFICDSENIPYDPEVLPLIAEVVECHIRDAIKAVEGVSMLGEVNLQNVERYLHLDANALYLDLLEAIGTGLPRALKVLESLSSLVSPAVVYGNMADVSMLAYRLANVGSASVPSYWDKDRLLKVGQLHQEFLVPFAQRFAERPAHPSFSMLVCDVSALHQKRTGMVVAAAPQEVAVPTPVAPSGSLNHNQPVSFPEPVAIEETALKSSGQNKETLPPIEPLPKKEGENSSSSDKNGEELGTIAKEPFVNDMGVHINPQAQNTGRGDSPTQASESFGTLSLPAFTEILHRRVIELTQEKSISGRPTRRDNVGSS